VSVVCEIAVEGVEGAVAAAAGGADRIELCASLAEGGITPSLGTLRATLAAVHVPVMAMIRPRSGDFLYSGHEFTSMLDDARLFAAAGAGFVFGFVTADGAVDEARTTALAQAAGPAGCTVHRAFDMTADPEAALESLIRCGVPRVLTSGQAPTGRDGIPLLRRLQARSNGRIAVMACGALTPETIAEVVRETAVSEVHFSVRTLVASGMRYRNDRVAMGNAPNEQEFVHLGTDPARVRATIAAAQLYTKAH
jgi:copper homeostasis protein